MLHRHVCKVAQNRQTALKPSPLHIVVETKTGYILYTGDFPHVFKYSLRFGPCINYSYWYLLHLVPTSLERERG